MTICFFFVFQPTFSQYASLLWLLSINFSKLSDYRSDAMKSWHISFLISLTHLSPSNLNYIKVALVNNGGDGISLF